MTERPILAEEIVMALLDLYRCSEVEDLDRIFTEFSADLTPEDITTLKNTLLQLPPGDAIKWFAGFLTATRFFKKLHKYEEEQMMEKMARE